MLNIKGYNDGADISLINTIYHKSKKNPETGKYGSDSIDIIFRDNITGEKKLHHINNPEYTYYMANDDIAINHNLLFIPKEDAHTVTCKYSDIKKDIAEKTGNLEWFYDNIRSGNYKENDKIFTHNRVFRADLNIEDYYRYEFDKKYKNTPITPTKLYFDIEVDGINQAGDFPEPGECPVNAITLIDDDGKTVYTLLLENYSNPLIDEFKKNNNIKQELKDFIKDSVGGWKQEKRLDLDKFEYNILFYDEEIKLIADCFNIINQIKPDFALAWNMAFDVPYLIARIQNLGYNPADIICHPDFKVKEVEYYIDKRADKFEERGDFALISSYTVYLDQLILFASRRKGQRAIANFKLDYVGQITAGVRKLDYSHITRKIAELPYKNYYIFVFYNIMDTMVQKCIEHKVGDIDFLYNKCIMNNTRYAKAHRQSVYLVNRGVKEFEEDGYIIGCNVNKWNVKTGFPGAYVADPKLISNNPKIKINGNPVTICDNLNDFDYKRLYPSIYFENNISPDTMIGKLFLPEQLDDKEDRFNNPYFNRTVAFIEDFCCRDYINFGERYLNLAGYEQAYDDIIEYFTTVENPMRSLYNMDNLNGRPYMCNTVIPNKDKPLCNVVDNDKLRRLAIIQSKVEIYNDDNKDN
mgnify:CR=1 FL=1